MSRYEKIQFSQFNEMVKDHQASLTDIKQPLSEIEYQPGGLVQAKEESAFGTIAVQGKCNEVGFTELCSRLNAPTSWIRSEKCPDDLEGTIINRLKQEYPNEALIRFRETQDGQICRAVLSDQYLPYNHSDLWKDVMNSIEGTQLSTLQPVIWKPYLSDYMDAWILFEGVDADPNGNGIRTYDGGGAGGLKPAIHLKNAEDGTSSVRINAGFYRSYCTNGVIFGFTSDANLRAIHRGSSKSFMRTRVAMAVAEAARLCGLGIRKFLNATTMEIKTNVIGDIVKDWAKDFKITQATANQWQGAIAKSQSWGDVVMATSDWAGTLQDQTAITQFEEIAGSMLMARVPQKYLA